jgi:hypothetical protein
MSARPARSISVRRVLQVGFNQVTSLLALPGLLVSGLGSPHLTGRAGDRWLMGMDPRGAPLRASDAATCLTAILTAGRTQTSSLNRPLRVGHTAFAVSGPGNPKSRLVARQGGLIDSLMARDRGVSAAHHLLYIRAGKVCARELARFGPLLHHLDTPAPLFPRSIRCLCLCASRVCVSVFVCAPHSAPPTLCLHGTCGCASCRDGNLT